MKIKMSTVLGLLGLLITLPSCKTTQSQLKGQCVAGIDSIRLSDMGTETNLPKPWRKDLLRKYEKSVVAFYDASPYSSKGFFCTGTLIDDNRIITISHCIDSVKLRNLYVVFDYLEPMDFDENSPKVFPIKNIYEEKQSPFQESIAILSLDKNKQGQEASNLYPSLTLNTAELSMNSPIALIQHPKGQVKSLAVGQVTHFKSIERSGANRTLVGYNNIDTEQGSSGAAMLNPDGEIVGIHSTGGCETETGFNSGVPLSEAKKYSHYLNPEYLPESLTILPGKIPKSKKGVLSTIEVKVDEAIETIDVYLCSQQKNMASTTTYLLAPSGKTFMLLRDYSGQFMDQSLWVNPKAADRGAAQKMVNPLKAEDFRGMKTKGRWQLLIKNQAHGSEGQLKLWSVKLNGKTYSAASKDSSNCAP